MAASIFNGSVVKILKNILKIGTGARIISGTVTPSSSATDGEKGSLYLNTSTGAVFKKTDNGISTNWIALSGALANTIDGSNSSVEMGDTSTNTATGEFSVSEGTGSDATGNYSHAEGQDSTASNTAAHCEGYNSVASGGSSHAEGNSTTSAGQGSHSEGIGTKAGNDASHAEGQASLARTGAEHARSSMFNSTGRLGSAQYRSVVLQADTGAATQNPILEIGGNEFAAHELSLSDTGGATEFTWSMRILAVARNINSTQTATFNKHVLVQKIGGVITITNGALALADLSTGTGSLYGIEVINPSGNTIRIRGDIGITGHTTRWVAKVEIVESTQ